MHEEIPIWPETAKLERVEELFHRAMELPASERAGQVAVWSGGDDSLRQEVLALLAAEGALEAAMAAAPADSTSEETWDGQTVGAYRLLRLLGRGGMGVVYLAEVGSGTELQARVAIKFVRRSLRGSPAMRNFLLERDALAALQHPNIARLLDAGLATDLTPEAAGGDEAVPYVVMEFIEGRRLDEVCDAPEMTTHGVVELMLQLCEAVGFAHRNLVLHRDLKPGNVMVSREGVVKLLDFGTLKMLGEDTEQSAMTQAGMRPMTLRYAAPEHVLSDAGTAAVVTTASDVYSLGMVLYRLLAGRLPPELDGAESSGVLEWLDHLRESRLTPLRVQRRGPFRASWPRILTP